MKVETKLMNRPISVCILGAGTTSLKLCCIVMSLEYLIQDLGSGFWHIFEGRPENEE